MTCLGCDSHTSGIYDAYFEGRPCPSCGLPASATRAILEARRNKADEAVVVKLLESEQLVGRLEQRLRVAEWRVAEVRRVLSEEPPEWWTADAEEDVANA